ncbi:hypothetical protein ASPVEDRAFT_56874 [Aspergillus versicolor CBS 583.65]|uniref:tetrahydrofolate synthase n=1 Tax=Aspergillus versicolor CBS 583.65 TaxID=1036611 RepID=A0A1L9Q1C2_ASPVE|nr:uncharacterized protein ASPVEDRAFT_56874 [Aspergillus versicolor CBS 583.65]OJJ07516.1 hypothetical protein ASPVEDRAFT_56874 [Aspergillus versicolor CBS 583.65]
MKRTYENAIRLLESRKRPARPKTAALRAPTDQEAPTNNQASTRGLPSVLGMAEWLGALGHNDTEIAKLNLIHVSGTKGKGSTCVFTREFLSAHGRRTGFPRRVGLYSGPHLISTRERIHVDGGPITREAFARYFFEVWDCLMAPSLELDTGGSTVIAGMKPRYLQFMALLAFHTFIREQVDAAIFEVNHGGEFDSTNVIQNPVVTGISSLGLDHVAQLGSTLESIAWHKSGIFKFGAPAFSVIQEPGPAEVMSRRAFDRGTTVTFISANENLPSHAGVLDVSVQRLNCSLALELAKAFVSAKCPGSTISDEDIQIGVRNFSLLGRFQVITNGSLQWFVDGAHNTLSMEEAAKWFVKATAPGRSNRRCRSVIFSHNSQGRDGLELVQCLARAFRSHDFSPERVIFTMYKHADAVGIDTKELLVAYVSVWKGVDPHAVVAIEPSVGAAINTVQRLGKRDGGMQTLITGSLHLVGEALAALDPSLRDCKCK